MSQPVPTWLQASLEDSHLAFAANILDVRETQREIAKVKHSSSSRPRLPLPKFLRLPDLGDYYSCSVGRQPANKPANRYFNLEAYDRTRVRVPCPDRKGPIEESGPNSTRTRYINANWIREVAGGKWWIGGQAPLPTTAHAFLTLAMCPVVPYTSKDQVPIISPRRVHTIVQLTQPVEAGRRRADPYFPRSSHRAMIMKPEPGCDAPPIHVRVTDEQRIDNAECIRTELAIRWVLDPDTSDSEAPAIEELKVTHLLYEGWPDFGVPDDNNTILNFARLVENINNSRVHHDPRDVNASPPILVHCSAGVGRTGSFISLCSLLRAYSLLSSPRNSSPLTPSRPPPLPASPLGSLPPVLDDDLVAQEIDGLREQRTSMVQKKEQAIWVYQAMRDAFEGK